MSCLTELQKLCRDLQENLRWRGKKWDWRWPQSLRPDSSARESPWTCQEGSEASQQDSTAATEPSAWLLNGSLQRALLQARTQWKITARSSQTKRPLGLRPCCRQRDFVCARAACCSPPPPGAAGPSAFLPPAHLSPWHCPKHHWCLQPRTGACCHSCPTSSEEDQAKSQWHSGNFKTKQTYLFPQAPAYFWIV